MKDGRTHLKYKVEHVVDLETDVIVAAEVYEGTAGDCSTIEDTVSAARTNLREAKTGCDVEEVAADKGYHSEESLDRLQHETHMRTYIPQPKRAKSRKGKRKPPRRQAACRRNRRNARGRRGRRLQRLRSEKVERTFAHVLETGGSRRTWLRGLSKIRKRYLVAAVAYNLGWILRQLLGAGKRNSSETCRRRFTPRFVFPPPPISPPGRFELSLASRSRFGSRSSLRFAGQPPPDLASARGPEINGLLEA